MSVVEQARLTVATAVAPGVMVIIPTPKSVYIVRAGDGTRV